MASRDSAVITRSRGLFICMTKFIDLTEQRFGRLIALSRAENDKNQQKRWNCICDCGKLTTVYAGNIKCGETKSCGCLRMEESSTREKTHGMAKSSEYNIWAGMKARCINIKHPAFERYGGRGIKVCDKWLESFEKFYEDMGERPSVKHSLDRIDNNGSYELSNCRWATDLEQARNTRRNIMINGISLPQYCEENGLSYNTITIRVRRGVPLEYAMTHTPTQYKRIIAF